METTSWMIFNCHMLKGPPFRSLPNLLAGTIKEYSTKAMSQLIKTAPTILIFFKKEISLNFKWPYQAMVMKVLDAIRRSMVYKGRI